jgi:peroxiredoxin
MGQTILNVLTVATGIATAVLAVVVFQMLRQQGRLLLRLDQVERHLKLEPEQALAQGAVALQARSPGGLAVGTPLPDFELPDLAGRRVSLSALRGRRVLLVHWSARCGFCVNIASDLARAAPDLARAGVELVLLSRGPAEAEQTLAEEHGLRCPILLLQENGIEAFAAVGTPAAYLLDGEGRTAAPLALGADAVPALIERVLSRNEGRGRRLPAARPLTDSRIERNGLPAGTPAPAFELPEIRGGTVSLADHLGRRVLLVFSDLHCGPCDQLVPHLVHLHERHQGNGLDLLLVGRGDLEENRRRAEAHGFQFPVAVQRRWELSRQYGIFATPVAFLIDERGVIADKVARGIDEILSLVPEQGAGKEVVRA